VRRWKAEQLPIVLTEPEIARLLSEPKPLPDNFFARSWPKPKRGHRESELAFTGASGSQFRLMFRMALVNQLDFSIILAVELPNRNALFRLRRYNGRSHEHTNRIEGMRFYDFHIHQATERYQALGAAEDAYAVPTTRYSDFEGALQCVVSDCACVASDTNRLF
jgi:hypothetical protein